MSATMIEKIIERNVGKAVKPGDIVTVFADRVMIHDIFIPFVAEKFEEMGFQRLWDPDKVVLIYDHLVPARWEMPLWKNTGLPMYTAPTASAISLCRRRAM